MKVLKWIRSRISRIIPCILTTITLLLSPVASVAYAAPAVAVPVTAELIGELLVALGLMAGNATDGYVWKANDNPYVSNIFESQVAGITSGVPVSTETLGKLDGSVIPRDVYTTDSTHSIFYIGDTKVTASDVFVKAESLVDVKYFLPTNLAGAQGYGVQEGSVDRPYAYFPIDSLGKPHHFIPVIYSGDTLYVRFTSISFPSVTSYTYTNLSNMNKATYEHNFAGASRLMPPVYGIDTEWGVTTAAGFSWLKTNNPLMGGNYVSSTGASHAYNYDAGDVCTLIWTTDFPEYGVVGDKTSLKDAIVQVKQPEDDDNNGATPPNPQTPNSWEIWQTVTDLIKQINTGEPTNGGTDFQQYVNNNYNYNEVNINVPDTQHIDLSGGLDINNSATVDITVHEDVSLPDAGQGDGFYNPDAADAVAALNQDNPVIGIIKGVFEAIDPKLVAIFSVSISFAIILGLWKLIRG